MSKYIGPKCKLSRREGTDLQLKSDIRSLDSKCKVKTLPGGSSQRRGHVTDYGVQLRMKQLIKRYYGVLEKQFHKYYREADRQKGATGSNLLRILESRLDNVVYRLGFASTRAEARQIVSHRSILVNGKIVNIPSYLVFPDDLIEVKEKSKKHTRILNALELSERRPEFAWLSANTKNLSGTFTNFEVFSG